MGTAATGGAIAIDVRRTVFTMLYRDPVLKHLLLNHADRLDGLPARGTTAAGECVLVLRWSGVDPPRSAADAQLLTARAHLPRRSPEPRFLDVVRQRIDTVLLGAPVDAPVGIRRLGGSDEPVDGGDGTLVVSGLYAVALAAPRPTGAALLDLPPYTAHRPGRVRVRAVSGLN